MRGKRQCRSRRILIYRITPAGAGKTASILVFRFTVPDHPRRCGENLYKQSLTRCRRGSPPQVRGKLMGASKYFCGTRITPAGAGKTFPAKLRLSTMNGSPPQVRGKPITMGFSLRSFGITPAGAGKTSRRRGGLPTSKDHPRRCGENHAQFHDPPYSQGSPPQVRGKLHSDPQYRDF